MTRTNTTSDTTSKPKQQTPAERASKAIERADAAVALAKGLLERTRETADEEGIAQVADLVSEAEAHATAAGLSAQIAQMGDVPYARRLTASGRAKQAADAAEEAANEIQSTIDRAIAEADDALLETLESTPGYTKNPEWIAVQERIEARRF